MESWNVQVAGDVDVEPRVRKRGPLAGTQNAAQRDGARFSEQDTAGVAEVDRRTDAKGEGVGGGDGGAAEWIGMSQHSLLCVVYAFGVLYAFGVCCVGGRSSTAQHNRRVPATYVVSTGTEVSLYI